MGRRKQRRRKDEDEYTNLSIRVERYEAHIDASVNHNAYHPQHAFDLDDREPLYKFITQVTIAGTSLYPEKRAGDVYEVTLYGNDSPSGSVSATLADIHARDEHYALQYRTYRGQSLPVFAPPPGLAGLHKVRGEKRWEAWIIVLPRFVSDMLVLLGSGKDLYIALYEIKNKRGQWVRSLSLQTTDPVEEF